MRYLLTLLLACILACSFLTLTAAQETDTESTHAIYEAVIFPDRSLMRRLEQADRLFEIGRSSEAAIVLGGLLENADIVFLVPEEGATEDQPMRTLHLTLNDYIIHRLRNLPREARESYAFQFEPTARRLLDNAVATGSLDDVQQVARRYFPTASGASATFLVALTQFERGDYAAASLTLDRLTRLHPSIPDTLHPVLNQMFEEVQSRLQTIADQPQSELLQRSLSESAWLEQTGWRLPEGSPAQNVSTKATVPLLEKNWTVPTFTRLSHEREAYALFRTLESGDDVYIPASQPLLVGDLLITRTFGETIAVDINTGKRLWSASEPEYRFPERANVPPLHPGYSPRTAMRFFFWHNRIAKQLSSDGERLFGIDGHDFQVEFRHVARFPHFAAIGDDLRFDPGSTLTARDVRTGRILWQVGKFPYVQKHIDALYALPPETRGLATRADVDGTLFTDDEEILKETWFLGAPLPLHGRLYVIGENDGILYLFVLESQTGRLIARQPFAHAPSPIAANIVRRSYPLFPAASGGIVICPTGNGLIAALDAVTLAPIWCFTYAPAQATTDANRRMLNQRMIFPMMNVSEQTMRHLFSESGWQVPRIIIDGQRVLVAPSDRAALYCLDLLTGELLWERTVSRPNALYVAGVHNNKVFVVTPINLIAFDMNTGEEVATHRVSFPSTLRPAGVGVHSGNQYFIPFTDGQLAVADLDEGRLTWLDASGSAMSPPVAEAFVSETADEPMMALLGGLREGDLDMFTPDLTADDIFQRPMQFGNLVGIGGRFFSQSPTQIVSFDQKEPLRQRAEASLQADPHDSEGLLQQGRILQAEGRIAEAIDSFRASLRSNPTPEAADALRRNLLEAMRSDYPTWAEASLELESLAEFPDEWGIILYAQIEGILQSGTIDDLAAVLERVFALGHQPTILIPVSSDHSAQLHRAVGGLIHQTIMRGNHPALRAAWEELAETLYQRLTVNPDAFTKPPHISALPPQWLRNTVQLPHDIQRWSMFTHIFRNTAAAEKAKQMLREKYEQYRLPIALDLLARPSTVPKWSELSDPFVWNSGTVDVQHITTEAGNALPGALDSNALDNDALASDALASDIDRNINRLLAIARNPHALTRFGVHQQPVQFLGLSDSELATFSYYISPWAMGATEFFLSCNDPSGQERWRLALPHIRYQDTRAVNTLIGEHALYIKGLHHFLLLVIGNSITAIDLSSPSEARILWSKTLSSTLVNQQSSRSRNPDQRLARHTAFPRNALFVSPHVVCIWDTNAVYGLDPLTGETLWVRKVPHGSCSILGDDEHLFLIFPDARHVISIDPASGREIESGPMPIGTAYYTYGTNIVFARRLETTDDYALHVCDLRDLHDRRRRALQIANPLDGQIAPPIPSDVLHNRLNRNETFIQMLHGDRFLSVANWRTKSLQIHDLHTRTTLLPDGNTMLRFVSEGDTGTMRCDVEFVGDHILVLFTKDLHIRPPEPLQELGAPFRLTTYSQVMNVPGISVGAGEMMLFDSAGNPSWAKPTRIETIHRLWDIPDRLPVMLFAVSVITRESRDSLPLNIHSTRLMAVDKRSGEFRFRSEFGPSDRSLLQMFRVSADPIAQEITFAVPNAFPPEIVRARFTDDTDNDEESGD